MPQCWTFVTSLPLSGGRLTFQFSSKGHCFQEALACHLYSPVLYLQLGLTCSQSTVQNVIHFLLRARFHTLLLPMNLFLEKKKETAHLALSPSSWRIHGAYSLSWNVCEMCREIMDDFWTRWASFQDLFINLAKASWEGTQKEHSSACFTHFRDLFCPFPRILENRQTNKRMFGSA